MPGFEPGGCRFDFCRWDQSMQRRRPPGFPHECGPGGARCAMFRGVGKWYVVRFGSGKSGVRFTPLRPHSKPCARSGAAFYCSSQIGFAKKPTPPPGVFRRVREAVIKPKVCLHDPGGNRDVFAGLKGIGIPPCFRSRGFSVQVRGPAPVSRK